MTPLLPILHARTVAAATAHTSKPARGHMQAVARTEGRHVTIEN
eukprot:CAMPEP_0172518284 /NCGR_PEP_ID=MMETSP1066-20121228/290727_1 /TAXON_ID=671091 /ORGANISM="Coscinodiscus wailesii, Strain CCMP2513" /LENGTH=43 /DNA_ID= /DNA_START= /DNA_END= /DNA_ORIENTATION=